MRKQKYGFKDKAEDRLLYIIVYTALILFTLTVLYPIIFIISASFSAPELVSKGKVLLWPLEPGLQGYIAVFSHKWILSGYRNTIFYTVAGTILNVVVTLMIAYPLSRSDCPFRRTVMALCVFTMFFNGGMIPTYILMTQIKFTNTVWAMLIPGALSVYNMIIVRTFMVSSVPNELLEASRIDGCSDLRYFLSILLPLSKPVIAVITLYYAVSHWNAYFNALMYLSEKRLYPLQIILRDILVANTLNLSEIDSPEMLNARQGMADLLKYALIIVSSAPVIAMYPFVQRYFIKGVMIGSVKG